MDDGGDLAGLRVLIVEDEFLLAMELETLLQQRGCMVLGPVPSVGQALTMLGKAQPDIALLDVNLLGEGATPIVAELQARGVPFVLITGYSAGQLSEPVLQAGPHIDKPVRHGALQHAIAGVLEAASPIREA
jgi:CheY-like chemotaxis protein